MATPTILRAVETHALSFRRKWRGSVFTTVVNPVLFLAAMGLGLGELVDDNTVPRQLAGVDYRSYLAPGLLAATAMQTASAEASFPVMAGIKWLKTYQAQLATPLGVADLALGHLLWVAVRLAMTCTIFVAVMVVFGAAQSAGILLALPAAILTGMAFAAPIAAYTASIESEVGLSSLFRFVVVPLFLFSGTFFPVSQLPDAVEPIAYATPLWHGVDLCRRLTLGDVALVRAGLQVAYLTAWTAAGAALAVSRFRKRLVQ